MQTEFPPDYARSRIDAFYQEHFAWLEVSNVERFCGVLPLSGHGRSLMAYNYWTLNFEVLPSTLVCNSTLPRCCRMAWRKRSFKPVSRECLGICISAISLFHWRNVTMVFRHEALSELKMKPKNLAEELLGRSIKDRWIFVWIHIAKTICLKACKNIYTTDFCRKEKNIMWHACFCVFCLHDCLAGWLSVHHRISIYLSWIYLNFSAWLVA